MKLENVTEVKFVGAKVIKNLRATLSDLTRKWSLMTIPQDTWETIQSLDGEKRTKIESELIKDDLVLSNMDFFEVWIDARNEELERPSRSCELGLLSCIFLHLMKDKKENKLKKVVSAGVLATIAVHLIDWIRAFFVTLDDQNGRINDLYERTISIYQFDKGVKKTHKESELKKYKETDVDSEPISE